MQVLEDPDIVLCQGDYTTCCGTDDVVSLAFFQRLLQYGNRLARHCHTILTIAGIEGNQAATILPPWAGDLDIAGFQHLNGSFTHLRKKTIYHTTCEVADGYGRTFCQACCARRRRR